MKDTLRIAMAQLNPVVGDIPGNLARAREARTVAGAGNCDAVVFPELFITGYPPEDLVLKRALQDAAMAAIRDLAGDTADGGPAVIIGTPWMEYDKLYNSVALLDAGTVQTIRHKVELPNYGPFDEKRVFHSGPLPGPMNLRGVRVGVPICEDIWIEEVCECLAETGTEILVVINGSPYWRDKRDTRLNVAVARITETGLPMAYLNQVGGQDELVFDGASFGLDADCSLRFQLPGWEESVGIVSLERAGDGWRFAGGDVATLDEGLETTYLACVTGLRDYVDKNRFPGVVLGLSGGIDSSICAAMAVDALGADRVHCVMMPYRFTARESIVDAERTARLLAARYDVVPIEEPVQGFTRALAPLFDGLPPGVAEENIQSRVRGTLLMAISNKFGPMVVTTGNKSELSVGYATIYGDMNGGFNPIKDIYKTEVYALARFRNQHRPAGCLGPEGRVIPESVIERPPSAELREDQKDSDSLPPYDVLDDILFDLVEGEHSVAEVVAKGHDRATVERVQQLLYTAEYKRRQSAPGVKVSARNFGRDRRYPITNRFRDTGQPIRSR